MCAESFEPGYDYSRGLPPRPWWDAVAERRAATGLAFPGMEPAVRLVAEHTGVSLDDETVDGPLPTLLHEDTAQPACPPRLDEPPGRGHGHVGGADAD